MLMPSQIEELIELVSSLDRPGLVRQFNEYPASFPLDFTADFLNTAPLEQLQHIFLAVCLQSQRMPELMLGEAA